MVSESCHFEKCQGSPGTQQISAMNSEAKEAVILLLEDEMNDALLFREALNELGCLTQRFISQSPNDMSTLKRILLVEDNKNDRELALAALKEYYLANEIIEARDGVEALDYLHRRGQFANHAPGNPAVVLLDLKMPRLDGLEVLKEMKSHEKLKMIPVVMLTGSREESDLLESYRTGVNAYMVKPIDFQQFVDAVKQIGLFWAVLNEPPPGTWSPVSSQP